MEGHGGFIVAAGAVPCRSSPECSFVHRQRLLGEGLRRQCGVEALPTGRAQAPTPLRRQQQARYGFSQGLLVPGRDHDTGDPVFDYFRQAPD